MNRAEFNAFCQSFPHATHVVQWGGADVWKIGGKVFVIGAQDRQGNTQGISFKCSPLSFEMLKGKSGCRPAPYLASRGMSWIQWVGPQSIDGTGLKDYIAASYRLVAQGLPKKVQAQLQLHLVPTHKAPIAKAIKASSATKSKASRGLP